MPAIFDSDPPADDGNPCTAEMCVNGIAVASGRACAHAVHAERRVDVQRQPGGARLRLLHRRDGLPGHRYDLPPARLREPGHLRLLERDGRNRRGTRRHRQLPEGGLRRHVGGITSAADDTDAPADDGNPCTDDVCTSGAPSHPAKADGTACTARAAATLCFSGALRAVLVTAADCPGTDTLCRKRTCQGNHSCGHIDAAAGPAPARRDRQLPEGALRRQRRHHVRRPTTPTCPSTATPARATYARTARCRTRTCRAGTTLRRARRLEGVRRQRGPATRSRSASCASGRARALSAAVDARSFVEEQTHRRQPRRRP